MSEAEAANAKEFESRRIICFDDSAAIEAFDRSFTELLQERNRQAIETLLPQENVQRFNHGGNWERPIRSGAPDTTMRTLSAKWELPWQALVDNDLSVIERSVGPIMTSMSSQFAEMLYGVVGAAAEKVGNVVNAKEQPSMAEAMLAMFQKIEFGVDHEGKVSMPQMHVGMDMGKRLVATLESQPPEFQERINQIIADKTKSALAVEAARRARFKKPPSE